MALKKEAQVSAQIAVRSASGKSYDNRTAITSENIADYLPAPDIFEAAQRRFKEIGFEVSNAVGNSFSITAPASTFEKVFGIKLESQGRKGVSVKAAKGGGEGYELPVQALPKDLAQYVAAATFSAPPDFGPTNY